jgi:hypothetical protein
MACEATSFAICSHDRVSWPLAGCHVYYRFSETSRHGRSDCHHREIQPGERRSRRRGFSLWRNPSGRGSFIRSASQHPHHPSASAQECSTVHGVCSSCPVSFRWHAATCPSATVRPPLALPADGGQAPSSITPHRNVASSKPSAYPEDVAVPGSRPRLSYPGERGGFFAGVAAFTGSQYCLRQP